MAPAARLLVCGLLLVGVGCGDDGEGDSAGSSGSDGEAAATAAAEPVPQGELRDNGIGPVSVGMTKDEVRERFGAPDRTQEVNFGAGEQAPQLDWVYALDGGELRLKFETAGGTLAAYDSRSGDLSTADGFTIGTPFSEVKAKYGDRLIPNPIGVDGFLLPAAGSDGAPLSSPSLGFYVPGGTIELISGGTGQPAGD